MKVIGCQRKLYHSSLTAIFLGTLKMPYEKVKTMILEVSPELTEPLVNNLIKQLPETEAITAAAELKKQYNDLVEAEQFLVSVSIILFIIIIILADRPSVIGIDMAPWAPLVEPATVMYLCRNSYSFLFVTS